MAPKATSIVYILALVIMLSTVAESRKLKPALAEDCYSAIFRFPSCLFEIIGASQGGAAGSVQISAPCCNAFTALTQECKFQISFSGNLLPVIQKSCGAAAVGGPSGGASSPPAPLMPLGPAAPPV